MPSILQNEQWIRKFVLIVGGNKKGNTLDLSGLHCKFKVDNRLVQTPQTATIRIYNLKDDTAQDIIGEYTQVLLQAGYEARFGEIFTGQIIRTKVGKENATDKFVELTCQSNDDNYNTAIINQSFAAGSTLQDQHEAMLKAFGVRKGHTPPMPNTKLARGKVMFGMARDHARKLAKNLDSEWLLTNDKMHIVANDSYIDTLPVVLNAATGLIGVPEQQVDGIHIRCLLNPNLDVGYPIKIDNKSILQNNVKTGMFLPQSSIDVTNYPALDRDGLYKVLSVSIIGDTRGNDWYSTCICQSIDPTKGFSVEQTQVAINNMVNKVQR